MHPILIDFAKLFGQTTFTPGTAGQVIIAILLPLLGVYLVRGSHESLKMTPQRATLLGAIAGLVVYLAAFGTIREWCHGPHDMPKIHTFGPLVALGSFSAILYIRSEGKRRGFDPELLTGLAVETLLVGVVGSRILFILITSEHFPHRPENSALYNWVIQYLAIWNGGLVWYGGLLPAGVFCLWRAKQLGLPMRTMADVFAPAVMLGLSIGRVGCLMAGDDHGKVVTDANGVPTAHWWTLTFTDPNALVAEDMKGKPLFPTQPHMGIGAFSIFLLCNALKKRFETRPLAVMFLMATLYPIHRFIVEFFRGDSIRKFFMNTGLSTSQVISIPAALIFGALLVWKLRSAPEAPERGPGLKSEGAPATAAPATTAAPAPAEPPKEVAAAPSPAAGPAAAPLAAPPGASDNPKS